MPLIEVLEARERARGDRVLGRARGLVEVVHGFFDYDVRAGTGATDVDSCVRRIVSVLTTTNV